MTKNNKDLRDQLLGQVHSPQSSSTQHALENMQHSSSASPHDHNTNNNIDPAIAGSGVMSTSAESGGDDNGADGRKGYGKRELSTSKRAAQNRAAQVSLRLVS